MKKIISVMLISFMTASLISCGRNTEVMQNGDIEIDEDIEEDEEEAEETEVVTAPTYDYENLPESNDLEEVEYTSYYAELLNERNKICYDEIYNAALNMDSEVALSKEISPESLEKIMNIIFLDTPELYMLDTVYSYELDSGGYVYKVYLTYIMTKDYYKSIEDSLLKTMVRNISDFKSKSTEYDAECEIFEQLIEERYEFSKNSDADDGFDYQKALSSMFGIAQKGCGNQLAFAKTFAYYCRQSGIQCAVMIGELTDTDYAKEIGLSLGDYKDPGQAIVSKQGEDSKITVTCDYTNFYAWDIVCLNDEWYNVDVLFTKLYEDYIQEEEILSTADNLNTTLNVNDYTISQSRLFYINEDVLGLTQECNSNIFQYMYRKGEVIVDCTKAQMAVVITNFLDSVIEENQSKYYFQFESEDTYNMFINNFDSVVESYNESNGNPIVSYNIVENEPVLSVIVCDWILYTN